MTRKLDAADALENYATTAPLLTRASVWGPTADGRSAPQVVEQQIEVAKPARYLDIGTGTGTLPEAVQRALPECAVVAVDQSPAMVAAARERGVDAQVADIAALPFADASFDVASAAWMLYHVPDLDAALAEVARVLTDDGVFVAATNGAEHLAELFALADLQAPELSFRRENGVEVLSRHFESVNQIDLTTHATFANSFAAQEYLRTIFPEATVPVRDMELRFAGKPTVFVARAPRR